jgi:hypothetical protein
LDVYAGPEGFEREKPSEFRHKAVGSLPIEHLTRVLGGFSFMIL